jgi:hypothetical protein
MNLIKIFLGSCGILGAAFSSEPFKSTYVESKAMTVECSKVDKASHTLNCAFNEESPDGKGSKQRIKKFKFEMINGTGLILSDNQEKEIFQVNGGKVVYHQRLLNDAASLEKVCVGNVVSKQ